MNTFLNAQQEGLKLEVNHPLSLHVKINNRGIREQHAVRVLGHYYPNSEKRTKGKKSDRKYLACLYKDIDYLP